MESCRDVSWEDLLEEPEDLSDREPLSCELVRVVHDVIDVPVYPSSVVTGLCDVSPCCSHWEFVEPQSFSFSQKCAHFCTETQEEMRYEGSPVTAPPLSKRRMTQLIEAGAPHWNGGAGEEATNIGSGSGERSAGR